MCLIRKLPYLLLLLYDSFLLQYTLMEDPVILPSSRVTIDRPVIVRHLLSDSVSAAFMNRTALRTISIQTVGAMQRHSSDVLCCFDRPIRSTGPISHKTCCYQTQISSCASKSLSGLSSPGNGQLLTPRWGSLMVLLIWSNELRGAGIDIFLRNMYYAIHQASSRLCWFSLLLPLPQFFVNVVKLISANLSLEYRCNDMARKRTCTVSVHWSFGYGKSTCINFTFHHLSTVTMVIVPRQCGRC
jgi:hypothetical protein